MMLAKFLGRMDLEHFFWVAQKSILVFSHGRFGETGNSFRMEGIISSTYALKAV